MTITPESLMPADYVCHMTRALDNPSRILSGTALAPADLETPNRCITVAQNLRCVSNVMQLTRSSDWYLDWGSRLGEYMHGPLTPALLTAPTLGEGLDAFCNFFGLRVPYMEFAYRYDSGWFEIELTPLVAVDDILSVLVEIPLLILRSYITLVRGKPMDGALIKLSYGPAPGLKNIERWFGCDVIFHTSQNALRIPAEWRQSRNIGANASVWETALAQCTSLVDPRQADAALHVRRLLQRVFAGQDAAVVVPSLAGMAGAMNMSARTLIRRLRASGTTYQYEIDAARHRRAIAVLCIEDSSVTQTAYDLGYSDPAAFAKAFKRWTGVAPGAYRDASIRNTCGSPQRR